MENNLYKNSPPVEMNNGVYDMISIQQSVRIDDMKFRTIGSGPAGLGYNYGGLGLGGLGPYSGALPNAGLGPGGAFEFSNPFYNAGDAAGLGLPQAIQPAIGFGSDALSYEDEYEVSGDEYGDEEGRVEDDYDYNEVRLILMKIQRHNPGLFKAFLRMGMPYYEVRRLMRKIISLTLLYKSDED